MLLRFSLCSAGMRRCRTSQCTGLPFRCASWQPVTGGVGAALEGVANVQLSLRSRTLDTGKPYSGKDD